MGSALKSELSEKNKYYVSKPRYYELKYFCLQYPIWVKAYNSLDGLSKRPGDLERIKQSGEITNPTERCAISMAIFSRKINMLKSVAKDTDEFLGDYILKAVTEGLSYETLLARYEIPCCRDTYYKTFRKFFWLLNKVRD